MKIRLSQLRMIIREALEELENETAKKELEEDEFTYAIAKAAEKGEKTTDVGGKKFPVTMSKEKAKQILKKQQ